MWRKAKDVVMAVRGEIEGYWKNFEQAAFPVGTQQRCAAMQQVVGYWKCCGREMPAPGSRHAQVDRRSAHWHLRARNFLSLQLIGLSFGAGICPSTRRASRGQVGKRGGHRAVRRLARPYSNPSIDTLAVVISVGHRISVRPFATAIFCVPLTE